jgi:hypothetical protein
VTWTDNRNGTNNDIFALQVLAVGTVDVPPTAPPEIAFERPGPNPALGPVTIRFALPHETAVKLAIYDAAGRRVRDLVSGTRPAGVQAVTWDLLDTHGDAVGPGLFFAQLEVEGRRLTRKITALR